MDQERTWTYLGYVIEHPDGSMKEHDEVLGLDRDLKTGWFGRKRLGEWEPAFLLPRPLSLSDSEMEEFLPKLVLGWEEHYTRGRVRDFVFSHALPDGSVEYRCGTGKDPWTLPVVPGGSWNLSAP